MLPRRQEPACRHPGLLCWRSLNFNWLCIEVYTVEVLDERNDIAPVWQPRQLGNCLLVLVVSVPPQTGQGPTTSRPGRSSLIPRP